MEAIANETAKRLDHIDPIPTRLSLIGRLKAWDDHEGWSDFFETYWKLLYWTAIRAGLNDAEAQDAVQETVISVMKSMPDFHYDQKKGSFKGWLLTVTRWRISDQLRKRGRCSENIQVAGLLGEVPSQNGEESDPTALELNWDKEWEENLMEAAMERVKRKVDLKHYQIFDLLVVKEWSALAVARTMDVNVGLIYLVKHRVKKLIKKEFEYLKSKYGTSDEII